MLFASLLFAAQDPSAEDGESLIIQPKVKVTQEAEKKLEPEPEETVLIQPEKPEPAPEISPTYNSKKFTFGVGETYTSFSEKVSSIFATTNSTGFAPRIQLDYQSHEQIPPSFDVERIMANPGEDGKFARPPAYWNYRGHLALDSPTKFNEISIPMFIELSAAMEKINAYEFISKLWSYYYLLGYESFATGTPNQSSLSTSQYTFGVRNLNIIYAGFGTCMLKSAHRQWTLCGDLAQTLSSTSSGSADSAPYAKAMSGQRIELYWKKPLGAEQRFTLAVGTRFYLLSAGSDSLTGYRLITSLNFAAF